MKPMLAHDYNKRGKDIVYPAYVQPKLDGIRVIAHRTANGVRYYSRNEKEFHTLGHLSAQIMAISPPDSYLDGEVYVHGMPFENICSAVKRDKPNIDSKKMQYWVFDIVTNDDFMFRADLIMAYAKQNNSESLRFLPCAIVDNEDEMKIAHARFMKAGFEGTMIRNGRSKYEQKRSVNLQKYKDFQDEEFEIIGSKQATGKDAEMVIFVCKTNKGIEFDVEPMGDDDSRREMWSNRNNYVGQWLTVKFQNYTNSGAPRFPVGMAIRNYE